MSYFSYCYEDRSLGFVASVRSVLIIVATLAIHSWSARNTEEYRSYRSTSMPSSFTGAHDHLDYQYKNYSRRMNMPLFTWTLPNILQAL